MRAIINLLTSEEEDRLRQTDRRTEAGSCWDGGRGHSHSGVIGTHARLLSAPVCGRLLSVCGRLLSLSPCLWTPALSAPLCVCGRLSVILRGSRSRLTSVPSADAFPGLASVFPTGVSRLRRVFPPGFGWQLQVASATLRRVKWDTLALALAPQLKVTVIPPVIILASLWPDSLAPRGPLTVQPLHSFYKQGPCAQ